MWNEWNEWNRERQRRGMESRAVVSRNGIASGSVAEWNNIPKNIIFRYIITSKYGERSTL